MYANVSGLTAVPIIAPQFRNFPTAGTNYFDCKCLLIFEFLTAVQTLGVLFFYCAIMYNFINFLFQLVHEKHLHLREGMRMIGLSDLAYWMSWITTNIIYLLYYTFVILIIGYAAGFGNTFAILRLLTL
jgi:hypothetical protein